MKQKERFESESKESKKIYDNLLENNRMLKDWYEAMIDNQPHHLEVAEKMLSSVRLMARFYELTQHKTAKELYTEYT